MTGAVLCVLHGLRKASVSPPPQSFPCLRIGSKFKIWGCRGEETLSSFCSVGHLLLIYKGYGRGSGEMAQWVVHLPLSHEGLSWDPWHPHPSTGEAETDRCLGLTGAGWPDRRLSQNASREGPPTSTFSLHTLPVYLHASIHLKNS